MEQSKAGSFFSKWMDRTAFELVEDHPALGSIYAYNFAWKEEPSTEEEASEQNIDPDTEEAPEKRTKLLVIRANGSEVWTSDIEQARELLGNQFELFQ